MVKKEQRPATEYRHPLNASGSYEKLFTGANMVYADRQEPYPCECGGKAIQGRFTVDFSWVICP